MEGRVDTGPAGWTVFLNDALPVARQRFTLAHELAHVVLMGPMSLLPSAASARAAFRSEESLCDALASGLLMPRPWVDAGFRRRPIGLATLRGLASTAAVSLSAAIVRLREVTGWRRALLHLVFENGRWQLEGEAEMFPDERGRVAPTEHLLGQLGPLIASRGIVLGRTLTLRIDGIDRDVDVELAITGGSAVVLLDSCWLATHSTPA